MEDEEYEYVESVHDFMTPYLRQARFQEAAFFHKVAPRWPNDGQFADNLHLLDLWDRTTPHEDVADLDCGIAEVGFIPEVNNVAVLEVCSETGQERIVGLGIFDTPRVWTPKARYYLFKHVDPSTLAPAESLTPGLRFLGEREFMPYPGTMIDGQMVHWEVSPYDFRPMPLPEEFRIGDTVKS